MTSLEKTIGPFVKVSEDKQRLLSDFPEPIGDVARPYFLAELALADIAYELSLESAELLKIRIEGSRKLRALGLAPLTQGRSIKRDEWETFEFQGISLFQEVARELELGTPLHLLN
jgi:hypothetical protein